MFKKIYPYIIVATLLVLFVFVTQKPTQVSNNVDSQNADLVIYWGDGCPHCENVKEFIKDNKSDEKMAISWKEVYKDQANQKEMLAIVDKNCPDVKSGGGMGVPFAFSPKDTKCFIGDTPIIDWIKSKTNQ